MTPSIFVQRLYSVKQSVLGISSLSVLSSTADKSVVTVSLNSDTTIHVFLMKVAAQFPDLAPSMETTGVLVLDGLSISATSSAPGRCHFSVQRINP